MRRLAVAFVLFLCTASLLVYAGGRKDNESHEVDNPEGFTESVNIEGKKPGKWNVYVEAQDMGGNTTIAGPHNIYIDPESDLPIARIINPQPNMHVQGNLNIVGTATDDDGVAYVELTISRGSDGKGEVLLETRAQGAEFWSYFLDTSDTKTWRDGIYSITAWAVDINGLSGTSPTFPVKKHKKHTVIWNLDRKNPVIAVTSHDLGALVSGKVNVKGTVWDGNGVDALSYSMDGGNRFQSTNLKYDKKNDIYNFDISIDTKGFEDGPAVIQFKARDSMKSEGALSFLVFANNTGPDVQILYPEPETPVNGIFTVAGFAAHKVGLASITWKLGKDAGEIPIVIGNPWWVQEFDIRGQNTKSLDLEIKAVDLSGNITLAKRRLIVDQDADRPKVTLTEPLAGAVLEGSKMNLVGLAEDDDGVASIFYQIGANPAVEVPCSGYFQFVIEDMPGGVHNLDVWAKDITGVIGNKVSVKGIVVPGANPMPRFTRVSSGSGKTAAVAEFFPGIDVNPASGAQLELIINSGSGLASYSYQLGSKPAVSFKGGKPGDLILNIAIPKDLEQGQVRMEVKATDVNGRETVYSDFIHVTGPDGTRPSASDSLTWVRPDNSPGGGRILLSTTTPLAGFYSGGPLRSVEVRGDNASAFRASVDANGLVNLTGRQGGTFDNVQLALTPVSGSQYTTPAFRFVVDSGAPIIDFVDSPEGKWVTKEIPVKFRVSSGNRIRSVEFSANLGSNPRPLLSRDEIDKLGPNTVIEKILDISALSDGAVAISIKVTDEAGNSSVKLFSVNKDTTRPEARLIVPISGAKVNGTIRLGIAVKEGGKLSSVVYARPETNTDHGTLPAISKVVYSDKTSGGAPLTFLDVLLDATMPLDKNMSFVFTDAAGNSSTLSNWPFVIDHEMDLPVTQISLPMEGEVISADFVVSGVCYDDDKVKQIYWKLNDGREQVLNAENGFSFLIPLSSMTDNEHSVTIYAEDIYGVKGHPVTRNFKVSLNEPVATLIYPTSEEIVGGMVKVTGKSSDANGIKRVQVSLDNGNTYNDADGKEDWLYSFNSKIIQDGNHAMFVKVWDNYDISAMYSFLINFDNTAPELTVYTPRDGAETTGPLYFTGQVMDSMVLESVTIKLNSLEGVKIPANLAEKTAKLDNLLLEQIDISSLPDGNYNVEIWATDKAKNTSRVSKNIKLVKEGQRNFVDILYPLTGQYLRGNFDIYGYAGGLDKPGSATLVINGRDSKSEEVNKAGYFRFIMTPEDLSPGENIFMVRCGFEGTGSVESISRAVNYTAAGPWVTVDTMSMGDFAYERPWLFGRAGYELSYEDNEILADKKADKEKRAVVDAKKLSYVELSFNNGRSFFPADKSRSKGSDWRYRLETGDMAEGLHYLIVRATMVNGDRAITRLLIQVDKTAPYIRLITPEPGGRYNTELEFAALASDDVELNNASYHLRKGDKAFYEIPGFIKGLYIEGTIPPFLKMAWNNAPSIFAGGATFFDVSLGLSFFGDNVKVQVGYGQMTQKQYESIGGTEPLRYGGHVLGIKLLANIYQLPFGSFLGPDWEWLSATFALGANFSLFDLKKEYNQSGNATWMSAMLFQVEFPKVTIPKMKFFRTFSLFTEGQLWFVPTDVNAAAFNIKTVIPHMILGIRAYVF